MYTYGYVYPVCIFVCMFMYACMQCIVAVCCSVRTAVCCSVRVVVCCIVSFAACCSVLQCACYSVVQCACCSVLQCASCSALQCSCCRVLQSVLRGHTLRYGGMYENTDTCTYIQIFRCTWYIDTTSAIHVCMRIQKQHLSYPGMCEIGMCEIQIQHLSMLFLFGFRYV